MIVVDASIALEMLLRTPLGGSVASRVTQTQRHAPHLIDLEFTHVLRRLVREKSIGSALAETALQTIGGWQLERHSHVPFLSRIWELRDSLTAYDASYVALAESLDAPLFTCDAKLSRSHGHRAKIVLLS